MSSIVYDRIGSGEPVVLIHGIGHRRQAWGRVPELLADRYDVITLDLPGHGDSPVPARPDSLRFRSIVDQLQDFFAHIGISKPHVSGNSLGGYFSLELGKRGAVSSVTALAPAPFWSLPELFGITGPQLSTMKLSTYGPAPVLKLFADKPALRSLSMRALYVHPETLTPERALGDTYNLRRSKAFWPFFAQGIPLRWSGQPQCPTTVVWGDTDRLLIPRQAERAKKQLPDARHVMLDECGHVPMHDRPDATAQLISEQVESAARADAAVAVAG